MHVYCIYCRTWKSGGASAPKAPLVSTPMLFYWNCKQTLIYFFPCCKTLSAQLLGYTSIIAGICIIIPSKLIGPTVTSLHMIYFFLCTKSRPLLMFLDIESRSGLALRQKNNAILNILQDYWWWAIVAPDIWYGVLICSAQLQLASVAVVQRPPFDTIFALPCTCTLNQHHMYFR